MANLGSIRVARFCTAVLPMDIPMSATPMRISSSIVKIMCHQTTSQFPQRSEEWFALRKDKLTTSTFSTALGFWKGHRRAELWHEKVYSCGPVVANSAMSWGVQKEPAAVESYRQLTGREVDFTGFITHTDERFGWLGASPDGVLGSLPDGGILEVKCPYNKGKPELGLPWSSVPHYYMPQVQGQMEIMGRDWVDLFCWTPNGSTLFRVGRDPVYWNLVVEILDDFWWGYVVPARQEILNGDDEAVKRYMPPERHQKTKLVIARSLKLASEARLSCREIAGHVEFNG